jgi:hypothetical protein
MTSTRLILSGVLLLSAACGDDDRPPVEDAGRVDGGAGDSGRRDAGGDDAGPPSNLGTCAMPRALTGTVGTVMIDGDTTGGPVGRDLGSECGNPAAARFSPSDVIAYTVPGDGTVALEFTMVNTVTDAMYDSVIQVRTACEMIPAATFPPTCFDDAVRNEEFRSAGAILAEGGTTIYFLVSGYAETPLEGFTDQGVYRLEVTARANTVPTLLGGQWQVVGEVVRGSMMGMDPDMDPNGFVATFQTEDGMPVDLNGSGTVDAGDDVSFFFDNLDTIDGMAVYTGTTAITGLAALIADLDITQASTRIFDVPFSTSEPMVLPVTVATEVGLGDACDAMNVCVTPLTCSETSMECEASAAVITACEAATALTIAAPTTTTTSSAVQSGMLDMGAGLFEGSCSNTFGAEELFTVTVPAGANVDVIATTDVTPTMDTDTVAYIRSTCADPLDELVCDDDGGTTIANASVAILEDAEPGTYTVFVEPFETRTEPVPYGLQVSLRPVLATGATCDPMEVDNRCAEGPCPKAGTCP